MTTTRPEFLLPCYLQSRIPQAAIMHGPVPRRQQTRRPFRSVTVDQRDAAQPEFTSIRTRDRESCRLLISIFLFPSYSSFPKKQFFYLGRFQNEIPEHSNIVEGEKFRIFWDQKWTLDSVIKKKTRKSQMTFSSKTADYQTHISLFLQEKISRNVSLDKHSETRQTYKAATHLSA